MTALPPPIPSPCSFLSLLQDPTHSHANHLTQTHAARTQLRSILKQATKAGPQADWAQAHKATSDYLPWLYGVLASVEADNLLLSTEPTFTWRSSLSTRPLKTSNTTKVTLPSLHFELVATLLAHALCLSNHAATLVTSLGSYETLAGTSTSALSAHDATLNNAAEMFCRAGGVLTHLSEVVIPRWEAAVGEDGLKGRPVEFGRDVITGLSNLMLATANLLAIRRLLSRSIALAHTSATPGPPLPPSHPSPSLLAKLNLHVYTLLDSARSLCKAAHKSSSSSIGEVTPDLRRVLSDGRSLAQARSYKWLAVDCGENGGRAKAGEAVGWLTLAKATLDEVAGKNEGFRKLKVVNKGKKVGQAGKDAVAREADSVAVFLHAYKKVNDTLHFTPVPPAATLQMGVPAGRAALSAKAFTPPPPAFKPRSSSDSGGTSLPSPNAAAFEGLNLADDSDDDEPSGEYFGQGAYF